MTDNCSKIILVETQRNKKGKIKLKFLVDNIEFMEDREGGCTLCERYSDSDIERETCGLGHFCLGLIQKIKEPIVVCPVDLIRDETLRTKYKEYKPTETIEL